MRSNVECCLRLAEKYKLVSNWFGFMKLDCQYPMGKEEH